VCGVDLERVRERNKQNAGDEVQPKQDMFDFGRDGTIKMQMYKKRTKN